MSNLIDYLDKVKDLPFDQEPLNILDKVCINEIGYLTYEKWLSASDLKETIILHDYAEGKDLNPDYSFMVTKERVELAKAMVRSRRFAGLNLSDYRSVLDKEVEKQFAAMISACLNWTTNILSFVGQMIASLVGRRTFS